MKIVATDIPKTIEDYQIALNAAFEGGKAYGAVAEREACAKVCEEMHWMSGQSIPSNREMAAAIRARGEK
jgi:hypothetical protein